MFESRMKHLLLLGGSLLLAELLSLVALALVASVGAGDTESAESRLLLLGGLDLALLLGTVAGNGVDLEERSDGPDLLGLLDVGSGGITLLGGLSVAREENELALVLVQAGDILLERLDGGVLATVIDGDTDSQSELAGDLGLLELLEGESTASTNATVVLDGGAADNGAEEVDGAGSDSSGLRDTGLSAAKLTTGLVEVSPHAALPLLAEMVVGDLLVVLDGHFVLRVSLTCYWAKVGGWAGLVWSVVVGRSS